MRRVVPTGISLTRGNVMHIRTDAQRPVLAQVPHRVRKLDAL